MGPGLSRPSGEYVGMCKCGGGQEGVGGFRSSEGRCEGGVISRGGAGGRVFPGSLDRSGSRMLGKHFFDPFFHIHIAP